MFNPKPAEEASGLEKTLNALFEEMSGTPCESEEFAKMADQLQKLYPLKDHDSKSRVSADVKATIAANLIGIALIVGHERAHVVTSKALNFIKKLH